MKSCVAIGIKRNMAAKGMCTKNVADRSGYSEQKINDMLDGRIEILAEYLPAIAKALGISIGELFTDTKQHNVV